MDSFHIPALYLLYPYRKTRSAFFPLVDTFLQISHRLSSGIFNESGFLLCNEAPGISFSSMAGFVALLVAVSYTILLQITRSPLGRIYRHSIFSLGNRAIFGRTRLPENLTYEYLAQYKGVDLSEFLALRKFLAIRYRRNHKNILHS